MLICYNCQSPGHLSKFCDQPAKWTRCPTCRRVCRNQKDHYELCSNSGFVSTYINYPNTARFATMAAHLEIDSRDAIYLMDGPHPMDVSARNSDLSPVQIDANNGLLLGGRGQFQYFQWHPTDDRRCVINIMDANAVRFSIRLYNNIFYVNKKIRVNSNGRVEFREGPVDNQIQSNAEMTFKVDTHRNFIVRVMAFGAIYSFEVAADGVLYKTPVDCPICYESILNQASCLTECQHYFCTKCILQWMSCSSCCPLCRHQLAEKKLRYFNL